MKLLKQSDMDSQILELKNPITLALQLGCLASILLTVITWLGLFAAMTGGVVKWALWPYVAAPIVAWVVLLGLPAMFTARRGALATLDALATTAEAWLARAGFSIDLNSDGYIGHTEPTITPIETITRTPVLYSGPTGTKLLTSDAPALEAVAADEQPTGPPPRRELWDIGGGVKIPRETLEDFIERIFVVGWGREAWVGQGKPLDRDTYDALLNLLSKAQLLEGRKAGFAGKLTIDDPATAKKVLGLI